MKGLKSEFQEFRLLLKGVPALITTLFFMSVFAMNLLANKSIDLGADWIALDCGMLVSWFAFLTMDMITKRFGPKAATELSLFAVVINLAFCLIMLAASAVPGEWGRADGDRAINAALDGTFGGTWYVVLGSTLAFIASAVINNFLNALVGKAFRTRPDGAGAFVVRSYVSTAIAQFADNLIFAFTVSYYFFGWSALQCVTCALTGMAVELVCEAAFSFLGYRVCRRWAADGVGSEYLEYRDTVKVA